MKFFTSHLTMSKPATFSKLIVIGLLGALSLLLVEIRFEHREALGEAWQSWIPLLYCGAMLALGVAALTRWHRGGRQVLLVGFAAAFLIGLLGLWFHSEGHPVSGVFQVLAAWALRPGDAGGIKRGVPPVLAPLAFVGLGSMGVLACSWRFAPEQTVQSLDSARDTQSEAPSKAGPSTVGSRAPIRSDRSKDDRRSMKQ
jgi:hypothetical protein